MYSFNMTYDDYLAEVAHQLVAHPEWRIGQTYFNVLASINPALATEVTGSLKDPFYQDAKLPGFHEFVSENW